jgi:biotin carboxylase
MTSKKTLLIAGGGHSDIPLIKASKALGFFVVTSGNRPEDLGHRHSDRFYPIDFSNLTAMLELAQTLRIDAICAGCNDFAALTAAYVAEKMGLPGHESFETTKIIHHKDQYRNFALKNGIPSPFAQGYTSIEDALASLNQFLFPIMVKPVDLTGGKGLGIAEHHHDAENVLKRAFTLSRAKRVVIEEFVQGSRHGFSSFIRDGKVVFHFHDNENYYLNPFLVSAASTPGNVPSKALEKLRNMVDEISSLLGLKTGIVHVQFILQGEDPIIIEICRRSPGDLYIHLVQLATGVDYPSFIVRASAGMDCDNLVQKEVTGYFTRHCVMTSRNGVVRDVAFDQSISENVLEEVMWWKRGDLVKDYLTDKFGIVFCQFRTHEEMLRKTDKMQELIRVQLA